MGKYTKRQNEKRMQKLLDKYDGYVRGESHIGKYRKMEIRNERYKSRCLMVDEFNPYFFGELHLTKSDKCSVYYWLEKLNGKGNYFGQVSETQIILSLMLLTQQQKGKYIDCEEIEICKENNLHNTKLYMIFERLRELGITS